MNIAVGTAFRNASQGQVSRFFRQVAGLRDHATSKNPVRAIAVEGDSKDNTRERIMLASRAFNIETDIINYSHGGPVFGSTESPARMAALSKVGNAILDGVTGTDDILVYVESDLIWDAHTVGSLIDVVYEKHFKMDVIAPLIMAGHVFYDIWAFRRNGQRFSPFFPYHPDIGFSGIKEVDSLGSCLVMRGEVARRVRMVDGALVQWCENAKQAGYMLGVHLDFKVNHP